MAAVSPPASLHAQDAAADSPTANEVTATTPMAGLPRVPWTTSKITGSPDPPAPYVLERAFAGLAFDQPVSLVTSPGSNRVFVMELRGKILSFDPAVKTPQPELFFDLTTIPKFRRAYGIAFDPNFEHNRQVYLCYVLDEGDPVGSRVSRFKVAAAQNNAAPKIVPESEQIVLAWHCGGHNGGCLEFGPDGYLYISTGDGSSPFPPDVRNTGQDISDLLASILRIDVNRAEGDKAYAIPADNPYVNTPGARGEVWAYGLRNPWRMAFDSATGDLWVGDVGWEMFEMIYRVERGGNYGWSLVEADQVVHRERQRGPSPILPPTVAHDHTEARSITGGQVYRGNRLPELHGAYVYGDYVTGKIWGVKHDGTKVTWKQELLDSAEDIVTFGLDASGELYVVSYNGAVHWLMPNPQQQANASFPQKLSETGLFSNVAAHELAPGVIPYNIIAPLWADGASGQSFVGLPGASTLGVYEKQNEQVGDIKGAWKFPSDAVLGKTVGIATNPADPQSWRRLETQILHRDGDTWKAYNYLWNEDQTDATLAGPEASETVLAIQDPQQGARQQTWRHASRSECILCHTTRAGTVHGFVLEQLDRQDASLASQIKAHHPQEKPPANQLELMAALGLFEQPVPPEHPVLVDPYDDSADLDARARTYLHVNCGHCHRRGGGGTAAFDVRYTMPLAKANMLNARPTQGTFEILAAAVVAPGDPYRSLLYYRMAKLGRGHMPHFGSTLVDEAGVQLIHDWIAALEAPKTAAEPPAAIAARRKQEDQLLQTALAGGARQAAALQQLFTSPSGGLRVLNNLEKLPNPQQVVATAYQHEDVRIRDLFERFVPERDRVARLGADIRPDDILSLQGDAARGKNLYLKASGLQCRNCHRAEGQGKNLGPDFDGLAAKQTKSDLLASMIEPSKKIDPKYLTYVVETGDGFVHVGLLVEKTEEAIVLRTAEDKPVRIAADNIEFMAPQQKSLMPDLMLRDMTAQEVADLLAYLVALPKRSEP